MPRILVTDDNFDQREMVVSMASTFGLETVECANGTAALDALEQNRTEGHKIHAVATDFEMGDDDEPDGVDVALTAIREGVASAAIVISTGHELPTGDSSNDITPKLKKLRTAQEAGVALLRKPWNEEDTGRFFDFLLKVSQK